jgi:small subunit ribosomal protein S4
LGPAKVLERKAYGPGQHGPRGMRKKLSDYALALAEKQKLRYQYGVLERQFRRYFEEASSRRGVTGVILLQLLETRLDNIVYRLGFANTRSAARQMVSHGHVEVNGRRMNVASANLRPGDVVKVKERAQSRGLAARFLDLTQIHPVPDWLTLNKEAYTGTMNRLPTREEIQPIVNEQLVVELYSR